MCGKVDCLRGRARRRQRDALLRANRHRTAPITIVERVDQLVVDTGILFRLDEMRIAARVTFAAAGAGYLCQVHERFALMEQGHLYYLGR